ncbi:response regulator [Rariglobus hedericola]|uniref:Response regulator n=1 Tax=Rariglobus hedericola TaxID=2597822 RepID=A0A556QNC2_9BACT|nr:response regulator [Rariglobus hedericola]TSJ78127.1 response regulator [Rariglobus hedericola]
MKTSKIILLVEDDPNDRFLFTRAAQKAGITDPVQSASDGQEAIDYLTGSGPFSDRLRYPLPDLVVLDLKLPLATGFEVLSAARQHPVTRHVPVVMLTSSQSEADITQAHALGANAYLVKPPSPEELLNLVRSIKDFWLAQNRSPKLGVHSAPASH